MFCKVIKFEGKKVVRFEKNYASKFNHNLLTTY